VNAEAAFIRDAIATEQYEKALPQWQSYTRQLRKALAAGSLSEEQMQELRDLYQWGRLMLRSAQAHLRQRNNSLGVAAAYGRSEQEARIRVSESGALRT
jgi:hypothetical protein